MLKVDGMRKMNNGIEDGVEDIMDIDKGQEELDKWFTENYSIEPEGLKSNIAKKSLDFTGTMSDSYSLLLRVLRGSNNITLEYHQNGTDGYSDQERFWYTFPIYYFRDLPSGYTIGDEKDGAYELLTEDGNFLEYIAKESLESQLLDDLIEYNEKGFVDNFYEFLSALYQWFEGVE